MRRVLSIILIALLLLNASGYYLLSIYLQINDQSQAAKLANEEYIGSDAIIIKFPLALPYSTEDNTYEYAEGKFTYENETFRIVKKKMMSDTLFIVCVKDRVEGKTRRQMSDVAKSFSETSQTNKTSRLSVCFVKDFISLKIEIHSDSSPWSQSFYFNNNQPAYHHEFASPILHPPQVA
jgi:hypothetical protein